MDLKELQTFKTILVEGNFSKAAQKLHYAQSTITMQIQRLEKEIGFLLFDRSRDLQLTPLGEFFAKEIDGLIQHWVSVVDSAKHLQMEEVGVINIGVAEPIASTKFPHILAKFREEKPGVTCNIIVGSADSLSLELEKQKLDFVIAEEPSNARKHIVFELLYQEKIEFIISKKFVQNFAKEETVACLSKYPLFLAGENCLTHVEFETVLTTYQQKPFYYSVGQLSNVPCFIHEFPSIGVISSSVILDQQVVKLPIREIDSVVSVGIIRRNEETQYLTKTKKYLLGLIKEALC